MQIIRFRDASLRKEALFLLFLGILENFLAKNAISILKLYYILVSLRKT